MLLCIFCVFSAASVVGFAVGLSVGIVAFVLVLLCSIFFSIFICIFCAHRKRRITTNTSTLTSRESAKATEENPDLVSEKESTFS